jgi:acyl-[acyl-carrier-protein]-phospholipid O-acyltransferase / long-chain-fatty-acid--[acyl-carrier-protein] ligase
MVPHQNIEDELHQILNTTERMCVVTSVPDEKKGERLIVLHTPLNGTDVGQVWKKLNEKGLPNLWVPGERDFFLDPCYRGELDPRRHRSSARSRAAHFAARSGDGRRRFRRHAIRNWPRRRDVALE